jgi:hypothetical protein
MKRLARNFIVTSLVAVSAHGQLTSSQPVGQVIKNFSMPQTDANGAITSMTMGDEAHVISANRTEIRNMKIDLYEGNDVTTVIQSPRCDLWKSINRLRTREGVIIKRPNMEITAQTMDWECADRRGVLRQNVRVIMQDFNLGKPIAGGGAAAASASAQPAAAIPPVTPPEPAPTTSEKTEPQPVNPSPKP